MTDYKCSFFLHRKRFCVLHWELFSRLKWHSCPFISPWLHRITCAPDVFDVCRITQGSVRRCRSLTPSLSRKRQALSSADFSNKNNKSELCLQGYNQHSIQLIRLVHTAEQNLKHVHFRNGPRPEQINGDIWSQGIHLLFWILDIKQKKKK